MANLGEVVRTIKRFGRSDISRHRRANLIGELVWLSKKAVREDLALSGVGPQEFITETMLRAQRVLELVYIFVEVFVKEEYKDWNPKTEYPRVIDLGGDIGALSVLYWKHRAPNAKIMLVEANPSTVAVVTENLQRRGVKDVEVINGAVSDQEGETTLYLHKPGVGFHPTDFVGERIGMNQSRFYRVNVPLIKPSILIGNERVDLLKVDIEGAESAAIHELAQAGKLSLVDQIIMEFHNDPNNPANSLQKVLHTLEAAGFTIGEAHDSRGLRWLKKNIDICSVRPSDKVVFTFSAKRQS